MSTALLIINDANFEILFKAVKLNIHQEVYFMKEGSKEIFETYDINGIKIQQKIGKFCEEESTFIWEENPKFIKRRSNFYGLHLKGLAEVERTELILDPNYAIKAPYFSNNSTYQVNDYVSGVYYAVLEVLQSKLNFTVSLFKRRDGDFGYVKQHSNGSYEVTGMVGDIYFNRADIIVAPLAITLSRFSYIEYLPHITFAEGCLFIPRDE